MALGADVPLAADLFHYMAGWATKIEGNSINISVPYMPGANFHSYTLREPVGVVGQIIPWNFPLLMAAWKLGPGADHGQHRGAQARRADAADRAAARRADRRGGRARRAWSTSSPASARRPGAALAAHPMVDKIAFTGSTEVGKLIVHAAAGNLKKVTLELGGKSPNIVFDDATGRRRSPAPPTRSSSTTASAAWPAPGCSSQESRFDEVVEGVSEIAKSIKLGPGMDADTQMGPLVSDEQLQPGHRLPRLGQGGRRHGRHRRRALGRAAATSSSPPCITDTRPDMKIVREEIFGPVVVAAPFQSLDDIAAAANDSDYGLGAGIWTKDISKAHALAKKLRAGTVWINCYNVFDASLPFGGYKQSGWGREMGHEALEAYTEVKAVTTLL